MIVSNTEKLYTLEEAQNLFTERKRRAKRQFLEKLKFLAVQKLLGAAFLAMIVFYIKTTGDLTVLLFSPIALYFLLANKRIV